MAEEPDRLSQLPDELLQHILHLAPCREAETTPVLSRRWRWLWPLPRGAVKIDIASASLRAAEEALAASQGPVQRLTIDVREDCDNYVGVLGDVLSHPASRGVQDVRIRAHTQNGAGGDDCDGCSCRPYWYARDFQFSFVSVPSAALRVLHITNCSDATSTPPPTSTFFPCLEVMRLRRCLVRLQSLQDMVVASPQLAALQLEYVRLLTGRGYLDSTQSFCCPTITTLVVQNWSWEKDDVAIELDVPRVQHFKYTGNINQFALRSPLPDVKRVYLHIRDCYDRTGDVEKCEGFWNFIKNFIDAKVLKLKLEREINYIAAREKSRIRDLLICGNQSTQSIKFCVEHLEIDAPYYPQNMDTGVAIGHLLQCCPALRDLRLKLNAGDQHRRSRKSKAQLEFCNSIDHFRRRRDRPVVQLCGDGKFEVSDIPGLSDRWIHFSCLRFNLRRLRLQFDHMDKNNPNCIGIQLVKFFVEKGIALDEAYIHDGNTKMWQHINCNINGYSGNPQPISEYQVLARMSQELSMNKFSSSKISGCCHPHKLEVRRTNPWIGRRSFTILPLADT